MSHKAPKKNPKLGTHPDLYAKRRVSATQIDEEVDDTDVVVSDWRDMSVTELKKAAIAGALSPEDYGEMSEYEDENTTPGDIAQKLQRALFEGLREELLTLDEDGLEKRTKPFVDAIQHSVWSSLEREFGNKDGENIENETYVDMFQTDLENEGVGHLIEAAAHVSEHAATIIEEEQLDETALEEVLKDPGIYDLVRKDDEYSRVPGSVWSANCGNLEDQNEGLKYDPFLTAILYGGEWSDDRGVTIYPGMSDHDLHAALKQLNDEEPYISITTWGPPSRRKALDSSRDKQREEFTVDVFENTFSLHSSFYESSRIHAIPNSERLDEALNAKLEETGGKTKPQGPENDDVAYTYDGTNNSVAGASARGMYVAKLAPKDLKRESAMLGHCIGSEANGHPKALREGRTQVFSIRTESGKSKFTIELKKEQDRAAIRALLEDAQHADTMQTLIENGLADEKTGVWWAVAEIKGKANRLAGFEAGQDRFTKPDDLRLVTDFLLHLGYSPDYLRQVRDIAPGIRAMEETGADPFTPPPKRVREHRDPRSARPNPDVSPAVEKLLNKTKPMGRFRA